MSRNSIPAIVVALLLQSLPLTAWGLGPIGSDASTPEKHLKIDEAALLKRAEDKLAHLEAAQKRADEDQSRLKFITDSIRAIKAEIDRMKDEMKKEPAQESQRNAASESSAQNSGGSFRELSREEAARALGKSFKIAEKDGKLVLMGVTTRECFSEDPETRKLDILVKDNDIKIVAEEGCDQLRGVTIANRVDLAKEIDLSMLDPKKSVCLVTESLELSGDEARHCETLHLGEKDRLAEKAKKMDEMREELAEKQKLKNEAAAQVIATCGRSDKNDDLLDAVDPQVSKLAAEVLGETRVHSIFDQVLARAGRQGAVSDIESHGKIDAILDRIHTQTSEKDIKILAVKVRMAEHAILKAPDLTLEERKEALEEQLAALENLDLDVDEEKRERILKKFEASMKAKLAAIEKAEKLEKANPEIVAARQLALQSITTGDQQGFMKARQNLIHTMNGLGCDKDPRAQECQALAALGQNLAQTNSQVVTAKTLQTQCAELQAKNKEAKCEQYENHLKQMAANPTLREMNVKLPQGYEPQGPTLDLSLAGSQSGSNAVTNSNSQAFSLLENGSAATLKFFAPSEIPAAKPPTTSITTSQNPQNSAANRPISPPSRPAVRTVGPRG